LLKAEKLMQHEKFNYTILRLSGIYGSGRNYMVKLSQEEENWPISNRWTNRIHEDDAANFITFLLHQCLDGTVPEKLYLVTDQESVDLFKLLNWIRKKLNLKNNINISGSPVLGRRLKSSLIPSLKFKYKYPSYKIGYETLIEEESNDL